MFYIVSIRRLYWFKLFGIQNCLNHSIQSFVNKDN